MMLNPDVDGYTKSQDHRKINRKTKKATTWWKPKQYSVRVFNLLLLPAALL